MAAPCDLRSSGDILPSVASSAEIEPFLPRAVTRTASSAASSAAAAMSVMIWAWRWARSVMAIPFGQDAEPMILARHARPKSAKRVFALNSPGIHVGEVYAGEMTAGAMKARHARLCPGHQKLNAAQSTVGGLRRQRGLGLLGDRLERRRLVDREIRQHLAVHGD